VKDVPIIIPANLCDFGLSAHEFRVVCRVARRGNCFESIPNMAKGCRMNVRTFRAALKTVVSFGIVRREHKPGATYRLSIAPQHEWKPRHRDSSPSQDGPESVLGTPKTGQGVLPKQDRGVLPKEDRGRNTTKAYKEGGGPLLPLKNKTRPYGGYQDWGLDRALETVEKQISAYLDRDNLNEKDRSMFDVAKARRAAIKREFQLRYLQTAQGTTPAKQPEGQAYEPESKNEAANQTR
jgi:hypothetical protein